MRKCDVGMNVGSMNVFVCNTFPAFAYSSPPPKFDFKAR